MSDQSTGDRRRCVDGTAVYRLAACGRLAEWTGGSRHREGLILTNVCDRASERRPHPILRRMRDTKRVDPSRRCSRGQGIAKDCSKRGHDRRLVRSRRRSGTTRIARVDCFARRDFWLLGLDRRQPGRNATHDLCGAQRLDRTFKGIWTIGANAGFTTREIRTMSTCMVFFVSIILTAGAGRSTMPAPQTDVDVLQSGALPERHDALVRIMKIAPSERNAQIWQALASELNRLIADGRRRIHENSPAPASEALGDYYGDLVEVNSQSRSASVIPLLVQAAGTGRDATDALARFGDLAVQPLLDTAMGNIDDLSEISGAIFALARMVRGDIPDVIQPLSEVNRARIVSTARTLVDERLNMGHVLPIVVLALSSGDASLRQTVLSLAVDPSEWTRRGVSDPNSIVRYRNQLQLQLAKFPL
jgi:hypothetical protein